MWLTCHWRGCLKSQPGPDTLLMASLVPLPVYTLLFLSATEISAARSVSDGMLLELCSAHGIVRLISQRVTPSQRLSVPCRPSPAQACQGGFYGVRVGLQADRCPKDVRRLKRMSAEGHGLHHASIFRACFPKAHYLTPLPESMSSRPAGAFFFSNLILQLIFFNFMKCR